MISFFPSGRYAITGTIRVSCVRRLFIHFYYIMPLMLLYRPIIKSNDVGERKKKKNRSILSTRCVIRRQALASKKQITRRAPMYFETGHKDGKRRQKQCIRFYFLKKKKKYTTTRTPNTKPYFSIPKSDGFRKEMCRHGNFR